MEPARPTGARIRLRRRPSDFGVTSSSAALAAPNAAASGAGAEVHLVRGFAADRSVGVFTVQGQVRPCGSSLPYIPITTTLAFHSGGTLTEPVSPNGDYNKFGIPGLFTRTIGVGTWWHDPRTRTYSMSMRYDYFIDGVPHGIGTVDRDMQLNADGTFSGPVQSTIYTSDGSVVVGLCGTAVNTRV